MELADMRDLGSRASGVQVQVLSPAPQDGNIAFHKGKRCYRFVFIIILQLIENFDTINLKSYYFADEITDK